MFKQVLKFFSSQTNSRKIAKNRLQLILIQDRMGLDAKTLDALRSDLIGVMSNYFEITNSDVEINILRKEKQIAFVANIPITNLRRRLESLPLS